MLQGNVRHGNGAEDHRHAVEHITIGNRPPEIEQQGDDHDAENPRDGRDDVPRFLFQRMNPCVHYQPGQGHYDH
jgi:hypothetical protein